MHATSTRGPAPVDASSLPEYAPTSYTDFARPESRAAFEQALAEVRAAFGREYPLVIDGERLEGEKTFESRNPARPGEVIGRFQAASEEQAQRAV